MYLLTSRVRKTLVGAVTVAAPSLSPCVSVCGLALNASNRRGACVGHRFESTATGRKG